jgi:hypothetical protein
MRDNIAMRCPEKENLQRQCSAVWNEYQKAVEQLGLPVDSRTGTAIPGSVKQLRALKDAGLIDPETLTMRRPYRAAVTLRQDHLVASSALSRHFAAHRC